MNRTISLWNLLNDQDTRIEIPIIQRDYAQGRMGRESLRERLLDRLKKALDGEIEVTLDFVYGSMENNVMQPLDGQQRLTTLWLMHWYIAFRAGELKNNSQVLSHFGYETRLSSSSFCKRICEMQLPDNYEKGMLRQLILNQTWFLSSWQHDPTIAAMLNTLCGNELVDKYGRQYIDGFDVLFAKCSADLFKKYWSLLVSDTCPICFYNLNLKDENLPLTDDLYIKMNARGEQLTDFENFKADLVDYARENHWDNKNTGVQKQIGFLMDNDWTDVFWQYRSNTNKIDDIFLTFINRCILNELIIEKSADSRNKQEDREGYIAVDKILGSQLYKALYSEGTYKYLGFEQYKVGLASISEKPLLQRTFDKITHVLSNYLSFIEYNKETCKAEKKRELLNLYPKWLEKKILLSPTYDEFNKVDTLTQSQRVIFLALYLYFNHDFKPDEVIGEHLKEWLRFACNMSSRINREDEMVGAMRFINNMSDGCIDILSYLKDQIIPEGQIFNKEQYKEEIFKAKRIVSNPEFETDILHAEESELGLHGSIRFLMRNDRNQKSWCDWENFNKKYANFIQMFDRNGAVVKYRENGDILKKFISYCTNLDQIESYTGLSNYIYDYKLNTWINNIFLQDRFALPLHKVLMQAEPNHSPSLELKNEAKLSILKLFLETDLLDWVAQNQEGSYLRLYGRSGSLALYPSGWGILLEYDKRDAVLSQLVSDNLIMLDDRCKLIRSKNSDRVFLQGWDIRFTSLNGKVFEWKLDNKLYNIDRDKEKVVADKNNTLEEIKEKLK